MRDGRELGAPFGPHGKHARHEAREPRAAGGQFEIPIRRFGSDNRRERPELLAMLDVAVEPIAHADRVRRGEQTAMAQRARPVLAGAVHPADDAVGGEIGRDPLDERAVVELVDMLIVFPRRPAR